MKMVKSLLLGSAAGVVALTGAQAADLPVKAAPVQYVKICSLYGAGFYYIPGTDTCLKVGGFVRAEWQANTPGGSFSQWNFVNFDDRATPGSHVRTRGGISVDARTQTEYGTLRAYLNIAPTVTDSAPGTGTAIWHNRAFIQFAGFTAGLSVSFFDFDPIAIYSYQTNRIGSSTGGTGIPLFAYTAQFGNGFSASISAESPRQRRAIVFGTSAFGTGYAGWEWPDVVGNVRVDQSWGSAQLMGAIHQVNPSYYSSAAAGTGGPSEKVGYALGAGLRLNLPMIAPGDFVMAQFNYCQGAIGYCASGFSNQGPGPIGAYNIQNGTTGPGGVDPVTVAYGVAADGVYGPQGSGLDLTNAWSVTAGFQHVWNPQWRTSVYGAYIDVSYSDQASQWLLDFSAPGAFRAGFAPGASAAAPPVPTLGSAGWQLYQIGSRTQWSPVPNLNIGVDVMYNNIQTSFGPTVGYENKDWWSGIFRVQRNFWP